jgi:hypothetical protein
VDINPHALAAVRDNAVRNGVADRIEVRHRPGPTSSLPHSPGSLRCLSQPVGLSPRPDERQELPAKLPRPDP